MDKLPEFVPFEKISRLNREIVITEKIDGSNAQILIDKDKNVYAGSRNRWLDLSNEGDNFGFAKWVDENKEELIEELGPGRHFGEWWGSSIQRRYNQDKKHFSLFNVQRWGSEQNSRFISARSKKPDCCEVVPIIYKGPMDTNNITVCLGLLEHKGSFAAPGFMKPEGVVIYHTALGKCFKITLENDEKPKSQTSHKKGY